MSRMKYWIGAAFLLAFFAALAGSINKNGSAAFDDAVGGWIRGLRADGLTAFFKALSPFVSTTVFAVLLAAFAAFFALACKKWLEPLLLALNLAVAFGLYKGLKSLFERPRPEVEALIEASGTSFPSGNALMSASFYGFLALLLIRVRQKRGPGRNRAPDIAIAVAAAALVLLIGVSRVYLGVHYPSDILAGYTMGGAWLLICAALTLRRA